MVLVGLMQIGVIRVSHLQIYENVNIMYFLYIGRELSGQTVYMLRYVIGERMTTRVTF